MTFDPFGDFAERGYLRNHFGIRDRTELSQVEYTNYRTVLPEALSYLEASGLAYDDILQVHKILFSAIYPWAGEDRSDTAPDIAILRGGYDDLFCHPMDCRRAGEHALESLLTPEMLVDSPGDAYSLLCYSHPFLDGNGRSLLLVHSEMLRRSSAHIEWENVDPEAFLSTLTIDLQHPNNNHLNEFLRPHLVRTQRSLEDLRTVFIDRIKMHGV